MNWLTLHVMAGKLRTVNLQYESPAECDRDADLVISEAMNRIKALQHRVSYLEAVKEQDEWLA